MFVFYLIVILIIILVVCLAPGLITIVLVMWVNDFPRARKICTSLRDLRGKTALITGANAGIGFETAKDLARRGARVILACRNLKSANDARQKIIDETGNNDIVVQHVELDDLSSVRKLADNVIATESSLDILINNAGLGGFCPGVSKQGFSNIFAVNYLSHFHLTRLLLDLLMKSPSARVVNVSSAMYAFHRKLNFAVTNERGHKYPHLKNYNCSKLAAVLHALHMSNILKHTSVNSFAIAPGYIETGIFNASRSASMSHYLMQFFVRPFAITAEQGAQTTLHCAISEELDNESGGFYDNCTKITPWTAISTDAGVAKKLWDVSMDMTQGY